MIRERGINGSIHILIQMYKFRINLLISVFKSILIFTISNYNLQEFY